MLQIPPALLQRKSHIERFLPLATIFGEGNFPPRRMGPRSYGPAAVRLAQQVMITGTIGPAGELQRELEALAPLAAIPETDRFWHTSETVYKRVIEVFGGVLASDWKNVYVLAGWGEPPEKAGFALKLRFPNGNVFRDGFGDAELSAGGPDEVGWSLEVVEGGSIAIRLAVLEVIRWLIGLCKVAVRSTERLLDSWPELLDATLEDLGQEIKFGPLSVYAVPRLDTSTGMFRLDTTANVTEGAFSYQTNASLLGDGSWNVQGGGGIAQEGLGSLTHQFTRDSTGMSTDQFGAQAQSGPLQGGYGYGVVRMPDGTVVQTQQVSGGVNTGPFTVTGATTTQTTTLPDGTSLTEQGAGWDVQDPNE